MEKKCRLLSVVPWRRWSFCKKTCWSLLRESIAEAIPSENEYKTHYLL